MSTFWLSPADASTLTTVLSTPSLLEVVGMIFFTHSEGFEVADSYVF